VLPAGSTVAPLPTVTPGAAVAVPGTTLMVCGPLWSSNTVPPEVRMTAPFGCTIALEPIRLESEARAACCWSSRPAWLGEVCSAVLIFASWVSRLLAVETLWFRVSVALAATAVSVVEPD
jgi:hypothetical protein